MIMNTIIRKSFFISLCLFMQLAIVAQDVEYQAFIYTNDSLADEITRREDLAGPTRGLLSNVFGAGKEQVKGLAGNYITNIVDLGVNAVGSLFTRNAKHKEEWEAAVKAENTYQTPINTIAGLNDFYKSPSFSGAMDPQGMRFDGIGCLRKDKVSGDTVFYISCHIDHDKIDNIINHAKFSLVLDTLIMNPKRQHLPKSNLNLPFYFAERKSFTLNMDIKLLSSWINYIVQLQRDQELGSFTINISVDSTKLDKEGYLRYIRSGSPSPEYTVKGESFIVPRSYMGFRDEDDNYKDVWGTGEYKLEITLTETCDVTDQYRRNWKMDRKLRKERENKNKKGVIASAWQTVTSQRWDELTKSWVITVLKAPAGVISHEIIDKLGLETSTVVTTGTPSATTAVSAAQGGTQTPPAEK